MSNAEAELATEDIKAPPKKQAKPKKPTKPKKKAATKQESKKDTSNLADDIDEIKTEVKAKPMPSPDKPKQSEKIFHSLIDDE